MATNSRIVWTHHTFNPWRGCTKVSDGCKNCYAETMSKRNPKVLGIWGDNGTRVVASEAMWREPVKWDAAAKAAGERHRVFCASLADVFEDRRELVDPRRRLFDLINETPNLDWLLLTKRPENALEMVSDARRHFGWYDGEGFEQMNIWLGTSIENQQTADERIPHLLKVPAAVRFLSVEPMLGPVDLNPFFWEESAIYRAEGKSHPVPKGWTYIRPGVNWIICGGESGHGARPFNIQWARDLRAQCKAAGVPFFMKQLGQNILGEVAALPAYRTFKIDPKGGDPSEWPADLRVRQWPEVAQ